MLLLVNVEKHQDVLGKIVSDLVKYGVPISLVAGPDKICSRCSFIDSHNVEEKDRSADTSLASLIRQMASQQQAMISEVKQERSEDQRSAMDRASESPRSTTEPTSTPTGELNLAIKRALSSTPASFPSLMTLPFSFFTPYDHETTRDTTSKNGSACDEEDLRLCSPTPSTTAAEARPSSVNKPKPQANPRSSLEHSIDSQDSASKNRMRKKRDRPLSLTKSGVARKGRKTYTEKDLEILEDFYLRDPFACANTEKRQVLCQMLSIDPYRLKVWFQNRRRKDKVSCESQKPKEEL